MSDNIKIIADKSELDDIANAVREKTGKTEKMSLGAIARNVRGMSEAVGGTTLDLDAEITEQEGLIDQIQSALEGKASNNLDTSDATATADDIVKDKTAYVNGVKLTGTHECSGGEGNISISTCTVVMPEWSSGTRYLAMEFLTFESGTVESVTAYAGDTVNNVICDSIFQAFSDFGSFNYFETLQLNGENLMLYGGGAGFGRVPWNVNGDTIYVTF